jgi:hypothetical protein
VNGHPRCPLCSGRGGTYRHGRFVVCECRRMDPSRRAAQRQNSLADLEAFRRVQERIEQRERDK